MISVDKVWNFEKSLNFVITYYIEFIQHTWDIFIYEELTRFLWPGSFQYLVVLRPVKKQCELTLCDEEIQKSHCYCMAAEHVITTCF